MSEVPQNAQHQDDPSTQERVVQHQPTRENVVWTLLLWPTLYAAPWRNTVTWLCGLAGTLAAVLTVGGMAYLYWTGTPKPEWAWIVLGLWAVLPAVYFWFEFHVLWKTAEEGARPPLDQFRQGRDASRNIWLAMVVLLGFYFYTSSTSGPQPSAASPAPSRAQQQPHDSEPPRTPTRPGPTPSSTPAPPPRDPNAPPRDVADALTMLKDTTPQRRTIAAEYLATVPVDPGRRAAAAQALDPLLDRPETRELALKALGRWGTKDNIPSLIKVLKDPTGKGWRLALEILTRFKDDPTVVAAVAQQLPNPDRRSEVVKALKVLGPVAQGEVLKYLHSKDLELRQDVADLLQTYQTSPEDRLTQTVQDLSSPDAESRRAAAQDLAKLKPDPRVQTQVAQALDQVVTRDPDADTKDAALDALTVWATKEDAAVIAGLLNELALKDRAYALLARLKPSDPPIVLALVEHLAGSDREQASKTLQEIGGPTVERVLIRAWPAFSENIGARKEIYHILGKVGSPESIRALEQMARKDRPLSKEARDAIHAINSRNR